MAAIAAVAGEARRGVEAGIGDDACVLAGGLVASTDMLVDGVHFDAARMAARDIGHRAAAASLSDMAAMGAEPICLLAAFGVPPGFAAVADLAAGMAEHGVVLAGGDLCRSPGLVVSVTAHRQGRAAGAALGRPPRRPAGRDRDAGRPGRERLHGQGDAASGRGPRTGGGRHRHARPLRRHRHRRAPARRRLGHGRGGGARAAAASAPARPSSRPRQAARTTSCWPPSRRTCRFRSRSPWWAG